MVYEFSNKLKDEKQNGSNVLRKSDDIPHESDSVYV